LGPLLAERRADDFVVVVDNGSQDGTADWMVRTFPEVEVVALDRNLRFAGGNNAGVRRALELGADVVVLLNNDTIVEPGFFGALAEPFARDEAIGLVGCRIVHADAPRSIWYGGGQLDLHWGWVSHRALRRTVDAELDPEGPTEWVTGCCLAARREVWEQVGGLDEAYYIYAEDLDFCLRARARDWRVHYTPHACLRHAVSSTVGGSVSAFKIYHKIRSRWQLFSRHGRGALWPLGLLALDVWDGGRALVSGSPASARAVLEAWWDAGPGGGGTNRYRAEDL
jgi:hypothetical protein